MSGNISEILTENYSLGIALGLIIGKPLGIFLLTFIAVKIGLCKLPTDLNWKSIGFVEGIGNSHSIRQYKYLDKFPFSGKNYYRLKQIDFDGREEFSKVIDAQIIEKIPSKIKVFPNPVMGGNINILIEEMEETHVIARLYNSVGQSVKTIRLTNGYNNIDVSDLQNGVYSLQTTIKNDVQILKVVISQ